MLRVGLLLKVLDMGFHEFLSQQGFSPVPYPQLFHLLFKIGEKHFQSMIPFLRIKTILMHFRKLSHNVQHIYGVDHLLFLYMTIHFTLSDEIFKEVIPDCYM